MTSEIPTVTGEELYRRVVSGMKQAMGDGAGTMDAREFLLIYAELLGDFLANFVADWKERDRMVQEFVEILDETALGTWETIQ